MLETLRLMITSRDRAILGSSSNTGAAPAAPSTTQQDTSDVSESSSSIRRGRGQRSSSLGRDRKVRGQPIGTQDSGTGKKGGIIRKSRGQDVEADQTRNWHAITHCTDQQESLAAQEGENTFSVGKPSTLRE